MAWQETGERRCDHLRRRIEDKTGRPLAETVRELYRGQAKTPAQMACACTQLAGEKVPVAVVEEWLREFSHTGREEDWAAMVPRLKLLLERLIDEEVERRFPGRSPGRDTQRGDRCH
ncbi:MAG: hypothetical protein ACM3ZC_04675 [Bacteroidota bacterium]